MRPRTLFAELVGVVVGWALGVGIAYLIAGDSEFWLVAGCLAGAFVVGLAAAIGEIEYTDRQDRRRCLALWDSLTAEHQARVSAALDAVRGRVSSDRETR